VKRTVIIGLLVIVLTVLLTMPTMAAKPEMHKVSGGGTNESDNAIRTVSFTAIQLDDQFNAKGEIQAINRAQGTKIHGDVLYLVVDGNQAWISGVVTISHNPTFPVGGGFGLMVQDEDPVDKSSWIWPSAIDWAKNKEPFNLFDWTNGNIQVQ